MMMSRPHNYYPRGGGFNARRGVIAESHLQEQGPVIYTILDFANHQSLYVLRSCYRSQNDAEENSFNVFNNVIYESDEQNLIRERPIPAGNKYECADMGDGVFAVKTSCIFSPGLPTKCYTDLFGEIECGEELISKVLCADVAMDCWVQFAFDPSSTVNLQDDSVKHAITYKLHSLIQVNPKQFSLALKAPWNHRIPLAEDYYGVQDPFETSTPNRTEYTNVWAYFLSGKCIYAPGKPRIPVLIALNQFTDGSELQPHMPIIVNFAFCDFLNRFVVYDMAGRNGAFLHASLTPDNCHQAMLSPIYKCPGFFTFGGNGLVHDPYGQLYEIYTIATRTSAKFCYVDPADEHAYTSLEIPQSKPLLLSELRQNSYEGIYIGNCEFFSPHLHFCLIRVPDEADYKVGAWYTLSIETFDAEKFVVTVTAVLLPEYGHIPSKETRNGENGVKKYEFLVEMVLENANIFKFVTAPFLGAIGIKGYEIGKCFSGNFKACAIQFPPVEEDIEHRPQIRPILAYLYKDYEETLKNRYFQ